MSGSAIGTSMNYGFEGGYSRTPDDIIEAKPVASDSDNIEFGKAVVLNGDNTFDSATSTTLSAANFAGVAVAIVKQLNSYVIGQDQAQAGFYAANQMCDVLQRGIISVKCQKGTPTAGGAVYVRIQESTESPTLKVGGFEAEADGSQTVQVTNCSWNTGLLDANLIGELKIKTINN